MVEVLTLVPLKLREIYPEEEAQKEVILRLVDQEKDRFLRAYREFIPRDLVSDLEDIASRTKWATDATLDYKNLAIGEIVDFWLQGYYQHIMSEEELDRALYRLERMAEKISDVEPAAGTAVPGERWPLKLNIERLKEAPIGWIKETGDHELCHICEHRQRYGSVLIRGGFREEERVQEHGCILRNNNFYEWMTGVLACKIDNPELVKGRPFRTALHPGEFFIFMGMVTGVTALGDRRVLEKAYFQGEIGPFTQSIDLYFGRGEENVLDKVLNYIGDSRPFYKPMKKEEAIFRLIDAMREHYGDDTFLVKYEGYLQLQEFGEMLELLG